MECLKRNGNKSKRNTRDNEGRDAAFPGASTLTIQETGQNWPGAFT